jgi:leucyl aminopeptidase (aminopeptidase T)
MAPEAFSQPEDAMNEHPNESLTGSELVALVQRVFQPQPGEGSVAILVDLPDAKVPDDAHWAARRTIAAGWVEALTARRTDLGLDTHLVVYPNVHTNNGDLPELAWIHRAGPLPSADSLDPAASITFSDLYATHPILIAITKFSATAPLKLAAKNHPIRAATMPGFRADMIPALRLDYTEVNRRVEFLKDLLDRSEGADFQFDTPTGPCSLHLDLRHRTGHASGGLLPKPGVAGNLPSGEAYIVPYEGEIPGDLSRSGGVMPVQFGPEIVRYRIVQNKAVDVISEGPKSREEAALLAREPAYGNLAELGLGVLAAFGVKPIGEILLDEKLGLHIAFGRSDHFGGQVGPAQFSGPEAVIHIDRVYVPETQPDVKVVAVDLKLADGSSVALMRNGDYVLGF